MNLIIDIGNTIAKMAVFDGGRIVEVVYDSNLTLERLPEVCRTYTIEKAIVATVIDLSRVGVVATGRYGCPHSVAQ